MRAVSVEIGGRLSDAAPGLILAMLLASTFIARAWHADQPIVENYVGRQIPTAMVARNLERGSGFSRPQLDTGPFPNYFVVEPPLFGAAAARLSALGGLELTAAGRLVSALGITLAGWGLFGLVRRRDGARVALLAVGALACFPITLRYGRAFQPDALMIGAIVAGFACLDRADELRRASWLVPGVLLLAAGFALKISAAYMLVPWLFCLEWPSLRRRAGLAAVALSPAAIWYMWAYHLIDSGAGSRASADNAAIWMGLVSLSSIFSVRVLRHLAQFFLVRGYTPLGPLLALWGLWPKVGDRKRLVLWWVWGGSATAAMALLAAKLHHEYYWLAFAPVMAVGGARGIDGLVLWNRWLAAVALTAFLAGCVAWSASTWRSPPEWSRIREAAELVRAEVPRDAWLVAPEALLFQADRRGCRLEFTVEGVRRAAGEWGGSIAEPSATGLVDFYRSRGARYFADVRGDPSDAERVALHDSVRRRYKVKVDGPAVIVAELESEETSRNAKRTSAGDHP